MTGANTAFKVPGEILDRTARPVWLSKASVIDHLLDAVPESPSSVFVSYAHLDASIVLPWITRLIEAGLLVQYDEGGSMGRSWFQEVTSSIDSSVGMIFVVSPRSVSSINCHMELRYAHVRDKTIAFIQLRDLPTTAEHGESN